MRLLLFCRTILRFATVHTRERAALADRRSLISAPLDLRDATSSRVRVPEYGPRRERQSYIEIHNAG